MGPRAIESTALVDCARQPRRRRPLSVESRALSFSVSTPTYTYIIALMLSGHPLLTCQPDTRPRDGPFYSMTTSREIYTPKARGRPAEPCQRHAENQFVTAFRSETTSKANFNRKPYSPTKSFAPKREYAPINAPFGNTTNSEFYTKFASQNASPTITMRPGGRPSSRADIAKLYAVTTTKDAYGRKPFEPTKSYAPARVYQPNDAPLGSTTNRDEYPPLKGRS